MKLGLLAGWRLVNSLLGGLALLFALVAVPVAGVALNQPAWAIGGAVAFVVLLLFAEGSYEEWRHAEQARIRLDKLLNEEHSRDATVVRIEGFAREFAQLRREIPPDSTETGAFVLDNSQLGWNASVEHLAERIKSELRMNAPGFMAYWLTNPESLPPRSPFVPYAEAFVDLSIMQLRYIVDRLNEGQDALEG